MALRIFHWSRTCVMLSDRNISLHTPLSPVGVRLELRIFLTTKIENDLASRTSPPSEKKFQRNSLTTFRVIVRTVEQTKIKNTNHLGGGKIRHKEKLQWSENTMKCTYTVSQEVWHPTSCVFGLWGIWPRAGSGVVRIDPLRFLAGCRTRRLNQV